MKKIKNQIFKVGEFIQLLVTKMLDPKKKRNIRKKKYIYTLENARSK